MEAGKTAKQTPKRATLYLLSDGEASTLLHLIVHADPNILASVDVKIISSSAEVAENDVSFDQLPAMRIPNEPLITMPITMAKFLSLSTPLAPKNTDTAKAEEWLTLLNQELRPLLADIGSKDLSSFLHVLNNQLQTLVFFVSGKLTFVDVAFYAALHPFFAATPANELAVYHNIYRWFDLMQHQPQFLHVAPAAASLQLPAIDLAPWRYSPEWAPLPAVTEGVPAAAPAATPAAGKKGKQGQQKGKGQTTPPPPAPTPAPAATTTTTTTTTAQGTPAEQPAQRPQGKKKEKKEKKPKAPAKKVEDFSLLDLRVGKIVECVKHQEADGLYVNTVDVGDDAPRPIVSGLVRFMPAEALQGSTVAVLCNLKPSKMRGVLSAGMVLAASNADHTQVEVLRPPEACAAGTPITVEGFPREPARQLPPKAFPRCQPELLTNDALQATYKTLPLSTAEGPCMVPSLAGAHIGWATGCFRVLARSFDSNRMLKGALNGHFPSGPGTSQNLRERGGTL